MFHVEVACFLLISIKALHGQENNGVLTNNEGKMGTISYGPPDTNSEESESLHMPRQLRCDACKIIAHLVMYVILGDQLQLQVQSKVVPM